MDWNYLIVFLCGAISAPAVVAMRVKLRTKCSWKDALIVALGGGGPGAPDR